MALIVAIYPGHGSKYAQYLKAHYGNMFYREPGIFTLPSFLYSFGLFKTKVRFKGIQKISMKLSEFEEEILTPPSRILGAILVYNCQLDFEKLKSLDGLKQQQLFVLKAMHEAVLRIADLYNWDKARLIQVYEQTYDRIDNDQIPDDFWDVTFPS